MTVFYVPDVNGLPACCPFALCLASTQYQLFICFFSSIKDLCERHEKGVLHKHQRALHKYSMMKKQMMSATVQNKEPESVEQLESRIVEVVQMHGESREWHSSVISAESH